jgi:hypothetical protein
VFLSWTRKWTQPSLLFIASSTCSCHINHRHATTMDDDEELRDLVDVLRQPLQGRPVLVPFGTQAFLEGTLDPRGHRPPLLEPSSCEAPSEATRIGERDGSGSGDSAGDEEYVIIRTESRQNEDGEEEEDRTVTRQQAKEYFEAEMVALLRATNQRRHVGYVAHTTGENTKQRHKEGSATQQPATAKPRPPVTSHSSTPAMDASAPASGDAEEPTPAFFEIREELDEHGQEVRAEAVDVSRQLAMLESDASGNVATTTTRRPDNGRYVETAATDTTMHDLTGAARETQSKKVISDTEYERLSARLDELALLEEQAESNKEVNTASRTGLQGGGWSSGFLNTSNKKKKNAKSKKPPNALPASTSIQSTPDELIPAGATSTTVTTAPESRSRAVSFDPNRNDVREIPRIGQRSALELKKPQEPLQQEGLRLGYSSLGGSSGGGTGTAAVASVVHERVKPKSSKTRKDKQAIHLQTGSIAPQSGPSATGQPEQPPKRLSRFAQERLRQQQEQAGR